MVNSWGPLLPYNSENPFIGTRDVPVTNCSMRDLVSLLKEYTACFEKDVNRKNNEIFLFILEKIANGFNFCQFESHKRAIVFSTTI